jgi:hypothetical protein
MGFGIEPGTLLLARHFVENIRVPDTQGSRRSRNRPLSRPPALQARAARRRRPSRSFQR